MKIAIIDYGMGNLRSVEKAFHKVGFDGAFVTDDPAAVSSADKAVLPGDGAFDSTMNNLRRSGVDQIALDFIASGRPFLGICVGMQVLLTSSDEGEPGVQGLNVIPGRVRRFPTQDRFAAMIADAGLKREGYTNFTGGVAALHHGWAL